MTQAEKLYKLKHIMEQWLSDRRPDFGTDDEDSKLIFKVYEQDLSWVEKRIRETIDLGRRLTKQEMKLANFTYIKWKEAPLGWSGYKLSRSNWGRFLNEG